MACTFSVPFLPSGERNSNDLLCLLCLGPRLELNLHHPVCSLAPCPVSSIDFRFRVGESGRGSDMNVPRTMCVAGKSGVRTRAQGLGLPSCQAEKALC